MSDLEVICTTIVFVALIGLVAYAVKKVYEDD